MNESLEILKHGGVAAILALVLYSIVDKVLVPLVSARNGKRNGSGQQQWNHQDYINTIQGKRLDRHDAELSELREVISEVRGAVSVSQAILERIEKSL